MKTLKYLLAFALLLPLLSCDDDSNSAKTDFDLGEFSIQVPENWQHVNRQGYDSKVGEFVTTRAENIGYDLGVWSHDLGVDAATHHITFKVIDGKDAKIVWPKKSGRGTTGVFFANTSTGGRFQMSGINLSATTEAKLLSAIETLHFK